MKVEDKKMDQQHIHYYYINREVLLDNMSNQYNPQELMNMIHLNTGKFKEDNH